MNLEKRKAILVITGTRADYGLLKPVIKEMKKSTMLSPFLLVTGMHTMERFGHTINEIKKDAFPIIAVLPISERADMLQSLSKEILGIRACCKKNKPDCILVLGDRDEALAGAIVASHLKIPVAHIAGGDITKAVTVDSIIRHAITKFSHLHFVSNKKSLKNVLELGEDRWRIFNIGVTAFDDIKNINFLSKNALATKYDLAIKKRWFLILQHPTPLDNIAIKDQIKLLLQIVSRHDAEKIVIYPNSDTGSDQFIKEINNYGKRKDFHCFKSLTRETYFSFLRAADLLLGNSSSGIVESSYFKIPTINIGERQKGRLNTHNIITSDYTAEKICRAIAQASSENFIRQCKKMKTPYYKKNASKRIIRVLETNLGRADLFLKK